uniref:Solute carrier family 41 member n=1 Tax=Fundulus heteroclitus TaxID=8078 RepID=A0A3Q2P610_FUNHE
MVMISNYWIFILLLNIFKMIASLNGDILTIKKDSGLFLDQLYIMFVPKSPDKTPSQISHLGTHGTQHYGSVPSFSQHSGCVQHCSSQRISSVNNSLEGESLEYSESDHLLSNDGPTESVCSMVLQILVPFVLAGLGTVSAGVLLDFVQGWDVFQEITELYILVPAVLGMKGNLEMTLASRLSTAVNAGKIESTREKWMLIGGNLALKQLQATILGLLASLLATLLGWIADRQMPFSHMTILCSTSLSTAFVASLLQGKYCPRDPSSAEEYVNTCKTPIYASDHFETMNPLCLPHYWLYSLLVQQKTNLVSKPSVGGNLVSIQSSRISTHLHLNYSPGEVPEGPKSCFNPCYTFFGSGANNRSAQVLLLLVLPGQLVFLHIIYLMKGGLTLPSALFTVFFISASFIQVFFLLSMADCIVRCLWRRGKDPDSYSIPYLTAVGDLLGTALLSLAFFLLWYIGDQ